ncbi:MAG TPA: LamG domain-containing protein [Micromonosporaceae bacterium]
MTTYNRGTEGRLNDILSTLGATTTSLWPFWESEGSLVSGIGVGDLTSSDEGGAVTLQSEFAPLRLPSGLYSYHFNPAGNQHLAGVDHNNYSFGNGTADTPFSVGAWIRPNAISTNVIMGKYDSAGNKEEWRFFIDSSGLLSLELHDASASSTEIAVSTAAMTAGQLVFVVATYDGGETAPVVNLYVDAQAVNDGSTTETDAYVAMENTDAPLTIGCSGVTATPVAEFHGRIALPFITGKALSAAEVTTLYGYTAPMMGIA